MTEIPTEREPLLARLPAELSARPARPHVERNDRPLCERSIADL
jgi:hypothetical protein